MSVATSRIDGRRCPSVARPPPPTPSGGPPCPESSSPCASPTSKPPIDFYSRLFGTSPAKRRPGYANFAIAEPPLKLVLLEGEAGEATRMDHLGVEVDDHRRGRRRDRPARRRRPGHPGRGQHHLLLRRPGQGLGHRPRRRAVGGLHRHRRRPPRPGGQDRASSCPRSPATAPAAPAPRPPNESAAEGGLQLLVIAPERERAAPWLQRHSASTAPGGSSPTPGRRRSRHG